MQQCIYTSQVAARSTLNRFLYVHNFRRRRGTTLCMDLQVAPEAVHFAAAAPVEADPFGKAAFSELALEMEVVPFTKAPSSGLQKSGLTVFATSNYRFACTH